MRAHTSAKRRIKIIGIDLAKKSFQVYDVDEYGHKVISKKFSRSKLKTYLANLASCLVAMEACGSAHHWGRVFKAYGHEVKLMAPQFVKPYVKANKNDAADAEGICMAVQRPGMQFVALKEVEQHGLQAVHRIRSQVVGQRAAQVNQICGLLLAYGVEIPKGRAQVRRQLPEILEDGENGLSFGFRETLSELCEKLVHLDERVARYDEKIEQAARTDERAQRLLSIHGLGPKGATALLAAIGDSCRSTSSRISCCGKIRCASGGWRDL